MTHIDSSSNLEYCLPGILNHRVRLKQIEHFPIEMLTLRYKETDGSCHAKWWNWYIPPHSLPCNSVYTGNAMWLLSVCFVTVLTPGYFLFFFKSGGDNLTVHLEMCKCDQRPNVLTEIKNIDAFKVPIYLYLGDNVWEEYITLFLFSLSFLFSKQNSGEKLLVHRLKVTCIFISNWSCT